MAVSPSALCRAARATIDTPQAEPAGAAFVKTVTPDLRRAKALLDELGSPLREQ